MTGEQDQTINFILTVSVVTEVCGLRDKTDTDHIPTLSLGWGVPSLYYVKHRIAPGMRTVERIRPNILREGNIFDELTSGTIVTSYQELLGLCGSMRSLSILVLSLTIVVRKGEEVQLTIPGTADTPFPAFAPPWAILGGLCHMKDGNWQFEVKV